MVEIPPQIRLRADGGHAGIVAAAGGCFARNGHGRTAETVLPAHDKSVRVAIPWFAELLRRGSSRRPAANPELLAHSIR